MGFILMDWDLTLKPRKLPLFKLGNKGEWYSWYSCLSIKEQIKQERHGREKNFFRNAKGWPGIDVAQW
jgi:hypothetical protein